MNFRCTAQDLVDALTTATRALSPRSTLPILEGVLIESCDAGLRLTCSDGAMSIVTALPAQIEEEGRVIVPGRLFSDVVRKLPSAEIFGEVGDTLAVTLRCGGSRATIAGKPGDLFPDLPRVDALQYVELPQSMLRDMIQQTSFAIATDESRKILTGALLEISRGEMRMVAVDGFRMALRLARLSEEAPELKAVIPGRLLMELSKIVTGDDESFATLMFGASQLMIVMGETKIYTSLLEGEFIKYRTIIPTSFKTTIALNREQLSLSVDRAATMARESRSNLIKLELSGDLLVLSANSEMGDAREEIVGRGTGDDLTIAFNVRFMTDVLKAIEDEEIVMHFNSSVNPCVITPTEGDAYTYLVLPVRSNV